MPFDLNSAKKAGKKSKRGPAKKEGPSIKEKMENGVFFLYLHNYFYNTKLCVKEY